MALRSVRRALEEFAREHGVPVEEILRLQASEHLDESLSPRLHRLALDVWLRLPEGWDTHADWLVVMSPIESSVDEYQAGAQLKEAEPGDLQRWEVRLVPQLERLTDLAIQWVIAHELAHVATGLPTASSLRDDTLCEDRANHLAMLWGFEKEHDACEREKRGN